MIDTSSYKKLLTNEHNTLKHELDILGTHVQENPDEWEATLPQSQSESERGDIAMKIEGYDEREALILELQTRYKEVVDALERIVENTYGLCNISSEQHSIEKERLDADPAARTCITHTRK